MICLDAFQSNKYLRTSVCKNQATWEMEIFNHPSNFARSEVPRGNAQKCLFRGCSIFVAMVTMNYCYWWKAVLTNKNLPKM